MRVPWTWETTSFEQHKGQVIIYREYGAAKKAYQAMEIFNIYCTEVEKNADS